MSTAAAKDKGAIIMNAIYEDLKMVWIGKQATNTTTQDDEQRHWNQEQHENDHDQGTTENRRWTVDISFWLGRGWR